MILNLIIHECEVFERLQNQFIFGLKNWTEILAVCLSDIDTHHDQTFSFVFSL